MAMDLALFFKILYAVGIGVLIGLERSMMRATRDLHVGQSEKIPDLELHGLDSGARSTLSETARLNRAEQELIGIRTYAILSLLGFSAALAGEVVPAAAPVILAGVIVFILALYLRTPQEGPGITTEIAAIGTCTLGMVSYSNPHAAGVLALLITIFLALKNVIHQTIPRLRRVELTGTLKFLVIVLIILPLLPNRTLDPYEAFNPYKIGFLVILISGISFIGYFLTKFLGAEKGLGLTGLLGGLTSSTAVTAAMATLAKNQPTLSASCAFATVLANATMFGRVLVVVALLNRQLMIALVPAIGGMLATALLALVVLYLRIRTKPQRSETTELVSLENPFSIGPALKFGLFFVAILLVSRLAKMYWGTSGLYAAALLSGVADVDAITLSIAEQTQQAQLTLPVGALAITLAVIVNSIVKSGLATSLGGWKFGRLVGAILVGCSGIGLAILLVP